MLKEYNNLLKGIVAPIVTFRRSFRHNKFLGLYNLDLRMDEGNGYLMYDRNLRRASFGLLKDKAIGTDK